MDPAEYGLFFAAACHAAIHDYPSATGLHQMANTVWANGGIVSAVCCRPSILPDVIDNATRKSIINGKRITGFTTQDEIEVGIIDRIKSDGAPLRHSTPSKRASAVWEERS